MHFTALLKSYSSRCFVVTLCLRCDFRKVCADAISKKTEYMRLELWVEVEKDSECNIFLNKTLELVSS